MVILFVELVAEVDSSTVSVVGLSVSYILVVVCITVVVVSTDGGFSFIETIEKDKAALTVDI